MRTNRRSSDDSRRVMHPNSRAPKVHHSHNSVPMKIPLQNTELIKMITKKQEEILKMVTATTTQKILGKSSTARIADGHITPTILGVHPRQAHFWTFFHDYEKKNMIVDTNVSILTYDKNILFYQLNVYYLEFLLLGLLLQLLQWQFEQENTTCLFLC